MAPIAQDVDPCTFSTGRAFPLPAVLESAAAAIDALQLPSESLELPTGDTHFLLQLTPSVRWSVLSLPSVPAAFGELELYSPLIVLTPFALVHEGNGVSKTPRLISTRQFACSWA